MGINILGWFQNLFLSVGFKRRLAALLSIVAELATSVPELSAIIPVLTWIAGFFGVTGIVHATTQKTVRRYGSTSIAAALAALLVFAKNYPPLEPFIPIIEKLILIFGAIGLTKK